MTQDVYMGRKIALECAARVLEIIGRSHEVDVTVLMDHRSEEGVVW